MSEPLALRGGYYDIYRRAELQAELDAAEPHSDVVLDLSLTEQMECSCIAVMIAKLREWRQHTPDTRLRLVNVRPQLAKVFGLLDLDRTFVIERVRDSFE